MIGKINYGTGGLTHVATESQLPAEGSNAVIYYIEDINTFVVWNSDDYSWTKLRTRQNMYLLKNEFLNDFVQETTNVLKINLFPIDAGISESPEVGDLVFDELGAHGNIIAKTSDGYSIRTQQANLAKKVIYDDQSWEMWASDTSDSNHYLWDSKTNILTRERFNKDKVNPIIYERYSVDGGGINFDLSDGTLVGARLIVAWDGASAGDGTIRFYYTKSKNNDVFTSNDEVATIADVYSILYAESGVYCGYSDTEYELSKGELIGMPIGHVLSENDWAYVMHYAENVKQYEDPANVSFYIDEIVEYDGALYKVEKAFTKNNWTDDSKNCFSYTGTRCVFIYRTVGTNQEWVLGMEVEQDFPFPDDVRLTTDAHNKMTIKASGVDTVSIKDLNVTNPKLADEAVTNSKIANSTIEKSKLDSNLQDTVTKAETCWYSNNLIVSPSQPSAPKSGYVIWIDTGGSSLL